MGAVFKGPCRIDWWLDKSYEQVKLEEHLDP